MPGAVPFALVSEDVPLILLPVRVNGEGPFHFVFDTGATHVVVGKPLAERLVLEPTKMEHGKGAFEPIEAGHVTLASVAVGDTETADVDAVIMDIEGMKAMISGPFDGILGYTFFKQLQVSINYPDNTIVFD